VFFDEGMGRDTIVKVPSAGCSCLCCECSEKDAAQNFITIAKWDSLLLYTWGNTYFVSKTVESVLSDKNETTAT